MPKRKSSKVSTQEFADFLIEFFESTTNGWLSRVETSDWSAYSGSPANVPKWDYKPRNPILDVLPLVHI